MSGQHGQTIAKGADHSISISKDDVPSYAPCKVELPQGWYAEVRVEPDEAAGAELISPITRFTDVVLSGARRSHEHERQD